MYATDALINIDLILATGTGVRYTRVPKDNLNVLRVLQEILLLVR